VREETTIFLFVSSLWEYLSIITRFVIANSARR
jgi:hypothetical protein